MITTAPVKTGDLQQTLLTRVQELDLRHWCLDGARVMSQSPLCENPSLDTAIARAARECLGSGEPYVSDQPGNALLALPLPPHALVIDVSSAEGLPRSQLITVLKHYHRDLTASSIDAVSIRGFNQQLTQSYEEVNLIYRMAKLLTNSGDPRQIVQTMCDELRVTLNYGWAAISFGDSELVLAPLRQQVLHSGKLPFGIDLLQEHAAGILGGNVQVLTPQNHPLAAAARCEVLVEPVTQDNRRIAVLIAGGRNGDDPDVTSSELQLVEAAANFSSLFHQNAFRFSEQRQQFIGTLNALSAAVDAKDPYTHGHSERVALLAAALGVRIGLPRHEVEAIRVAGMLHDIGKIGVPEAVLRKPGRLDESEFELIKQHPDIGYRILRDIPSLRYQLPGVLHHHERWDGRGYPHGLAGEQIPLIARVMALGDTFDAMSSHRAYRKALDRADVLAEIRASSGKQFDPALTEPFVTMDFSAFDHLLSRWQPSN